MILSADGSHAQPLRHIAGALTGSRTAGRGLRQIPPTDELKKRRTKTSPKAAQGAREAENWPVVSEMSLEITLCFVPASMSYSESTLSSASGIGLLVVEVPGWLEPAPVAICLRSCAHSRPTRQAVTHWPARKLFGPRETP